MNQELCWNTNYGFKFDNDYKLDSITQNRLVDFIHKLSNKIDEKNVENKINQIEKDYQDKLKDIEILCKNKKFVEELKQKNSLLILQKELEIIKLLTKYTLQNKNINYEFFLSCLNILLGLSETLRIRLGQKEINHDKQAEQKEKEKKEKQTEEKLAQKQDEEKQEEYDEKQEEEKQKQEDEKQEQKQDELTISRCSYKFCSYQDNCSYNYNTKSKSLCYQDHYVHNMVSADLKILINYIKVKNEKNNLVLHNKEILKTINTLSFVIGHMELELKTKCLYMVEGEWELCHVVKNK